MPSLSALFGVGAATLFSVASATKYAPVDTLPGSSFFDHFDFVTEEKTNGFVKYVDRNTAEQKQYISYEDGDAIFGVDHTSMLNSTDGGDIGRESVRLEGKKDYNKGLFVLDIKHMPGGICGTWPAFWALGREPWPVKGEIDILEGVNKDTVNTLTLHTDTECKVDGSSQTGRLAAVDCALTAGTTGCDVGDPRTTSYGAGFNANSGGHYVTEWQDSGIKIWFFPRGSAPNSLSTSEPDTAEFGTPVASFQGECDIEKHFMDQRFIFTNTFCGDWAGVVYEQSGCPMYEGLSGMASCKKYVAEHPSLYKEAYWRVSSFKTYDARAANSSSSVVPSSTPHVSSNSSSSAYATNSPVAVSSSIAPFSNSTVQASSSSVHAPSTSVFASSSSATRAPAASSPLSPSTAAPSPLSPVAVSSSVSRDPSSTISAAASASVYVSATSHSSSFNSSSSSSSALRVSSSVLASSASASETPHSQDGAVTVSRSSASASATVAGISSSRNSSSTATSSVSASETPKASVFSSSASRVSSSVLASSASASETPHSQDGAVTVSRSSASASATVAGISSSRNSSSTATSSVSASETPYASSIVSSASNFSSSTLASSASGSPYSLNATSTISSVSASETPYLSTVSAILTTTTTITYAAQSVSPSATLPASSSVVSSSEDPSNITSSLPLSSTRPANNQTTTAYETTYVDVGSTGYVTITATITATLTTQVTATQTAAPHSTSDADPAPPGFEVTTKYCAQGCGAGPTAVTVTVPYTHGAPGRPTNFPGRPFGHYNPGHHGSHYPSDNTRYGHGQHDQPGKHGKPGNTHHGQPGKASAHDNAHHNPAQPDLRGKPSPDHPGDHHAPHNAKKSMVPATNATQSHTAVSTSPVPTSKVTTSAATPTGEVFPSSVSTSAASGIRVEGLLVAWSVGLWVAWGIAVYAVVVMGVDVI